MRRFPHLLVAAAVVAALVAGGARGLFYAGLVAALLELLLLRARLIDLSRVRRRRRSTAEPADALERSFSQLRDELYWTAHSRREFDRTLRPRLTRILGVRLVEGRGVRLDRSPARAQELVGPQTWALLDPNRPNTMDRSLSGVSTSELRRTVERLEAL
jgi:hypothetical protein